MQDRVLVKWVNDLALFNLSIKVIDNKLFKRWIIIIDLEQLFQFKLPKNKILNLFISNKLVKRNIKIIISKKMYKCIK